MSDREGVALFAFYKRVTRANCSLTKSDMSDSLFAPCFWQFSLLFPLLCPRANRSLHSPLLFKERGEHLAHSHSPQRATVSNSLPLLFTKEWRERFLEKSEGLFCSFAKKNKQFTQKTKEWIPNPEEWGLGNTVILRKRMVNTLTIRMVNTLTIRMVNTLYKNGEHSNYSIRMVNTLTIRMVNTLLLLGSL